MHRLDLLRTFACAALVAGVVMGCGGSDSTTVILVRHAEKAAGEDPPLTDEGTARAQSLADLIEADPVDAIIVTPWQRTQLTAEPTAERLGLTPIVVPTNTPDHPSRVASRILDGYAGRRVLVVGHSNTLPDIMSSLGVASAPAIADDDYDGWFVVRVPGDGSEATLATSTYGR